MRRILHTILFLSFSLFLVSCGGGGGGGGVAGTPCSPGAASFFYEVSNPLDCANSAAGNLIDNATLTDTYAFSDGAGGGGGGDGGGGGGGGGGGAGDIWLRIAAAFKNTVYALLGHSNAYAQSISACSAAGVDQSDLNRLTSTGWKYQPLVKPGTAAGTTCVQRIFDAKQYIAVYALGLAKYDQTCYLLMVKKSDGTTHCFSSTVALTLEDENLITPPTSNFSDSMSPSLFSSPSMTLSGNKKYLGVLFRSMDGGVRQRLVRLNVDPQNGAGIVADLVFDSDVIKATTPWNGSGVLKFQKQFILNSGKAVSHYYDSQAGGSVATGYTYLSDTTNLTSPTLVNNNSQKNPQCIIQDPSADDVFLGVFSNGTDNQLYKLDSAQASISTISSVSNVSCAYGAVAKNGKFYYLATYAHDTDGTTIPGNGLKQGMLVYSIDLSNGTKTTTAMKLPQASFSTQCTSGTNTVTFSGSSGALHTGTLFLTENNDFVIAGRTATDFNSSGKVDTLPSTVGNSVIKVFDSNETLKLNLLNYADCNFIRKFEQGTSGNFALLTEPTASGSLVSQTTRILNSNFQTLNGNGNGLTVTANFFLKLGGMLNPL